MRAALLKDYRSYDLKLCRSEPELAIVMTSIPGEVAVPVKTERTTTPGLLRGFAWASFSVAIFSGWFVVTRLGLSHSLQVWDVIALRFGEGALLLTPALLFGGSRLPLRAWLTGIPLAVLWGAPFVFFVGTGLRLTSAMLASSIAPALMPIFAGVFVWITRGQFPRRVELCGYALIMAGLVLLVWISAPGDGQVNTVGILALIVAAAMWALYTLHLKASGLSPLQATALICFWSTIFYLPIYLGAGLSNLSRASAGELLFQSAYQGVLMSVVAVFAFNRAVASLGPRASSAIVALMPVAVVLFAMPVLNEFPSMIASASICGIAFGVMLTAAPSKPARQ
jgi:drug/metabolite transporter (DMT)-like permease